MKHILIILAIFSFFTSLTVFSQKSDKVYKTFSDTTFSIGDIILAPAIYFTIDGGASVIPEHKDSVKIIAAFLTRYPNISIEIGVHSDSRGALEYEQMLSEIRANSVKNVLVDEFGIQPKRIEVKGYGKSKLIVTDAEIDQAHSNEVKEKLHAKNRRIEIKMVKK